MSGAGQRGNDLYQLLMEIDRLEELREELEERDLHSIDDIERRIEEISARVEAIESTHTKQS